MSLAREKTATVLGGGSWGTALASILGSHGYDTLLWMRDEAIADAVNASHRNPRYLGDAPIHEGVTATVDLTQAAGHAEVIIVAIPSKHLRGVMVQVGEHLTGDQIVISATKGLEASGLKRMSQVIADETCVRKIGAISGPNLAREIVGGQPAATVVASPFEGVIQKVERMLAGPTFRLYGNFDLPGTEYAGALKNIYAIAGGVAAGLGFGANTLSTLITRGLAEMSRFGERYGAQRLTFQGLAGVGDLVATCSSTLSRNHTVGRHLAKGEQLDDIIENLGMVAEGVNTTRVIHTHAVREGIDMPIASAVYRLLFEGATPQDALALLMARESRYEGQDAFIHRPSVPGTVVPPRVEKP
ncbi:MAG: NAD(P)H-dependent glycerol-3-phosphate dehydrogenase [Myxococcota bacterium]|nr:NAD(P)H-dependent glycerol-3-phosphate dehydrogenase [Myxococcota bacterium]